MKRLPVYRLMLFLGVFLLSPFAEAASGAQTATNEGVYSDGTGENIACPPLQILSYDSTIYLCDSQEVCFDVIALNAMGNALDIVQVEGPGAFERLTDTSGQTCFAPENVDSATYLFRYTVAVEGDTTSALSCCPQDSIRITVIMNQPPVISCPEAQVFFSCEPDTFRFDIEASDPEDGPLTFTVLSENAAIDSQTVSIVATQTTETEVVIEAVDDCGHADTCTVPVSITINSHPYVTLADDFSLALCQPETVCITAYADDPDFEPLEVSVNYGTYDESSNLVCFEADTVGSYEIIMTAVDSCGATASDTAVVTVTMNGMPTVSMGEDFSLFVCGETEVCLDAAVSDDNLTMVYSNLGTYDSLTGQVCFTIDTAGVYEVILTATDECEQTVSDTVVVTASGGAPPTVNLGEDFSVSQCEPTEVCVGVETIDMFKSLTSNFGVYDENTGQLCFTPDTAGMYSLIVTVTDSCDLSASDTVNITVDLSSPPVVSGLNDTTLYLCRPEKICLDVNVSDADNDIVSVSTNLNAEYADGIVCFVPYDSGQYELIVTAVDSCDHITADTALVTVLTDQGISIDCPSDTTIFTCQWVDTFCLPIEGIPEGAEVEVTGINAWYDAETESICFWSECSNSNHIQVSVSTPCNTFTCEFVVNIECNSDPLVILPPDMTVPTCDSVDVCVPVGISDIDNNLMDIVVTGGDYNPVTNRICFTADTPGVYTVQVTATDSCDAVDSDEMLITVVQNSPPEISADVGDTLLMMCEPQQVCLPVTVSDVDDNIVNISTSFGYYDSQYGQLCFTPDTAGQYCIELIATDECGLADTAEVCVQVTTGDYVSISCPSEPLAENICQPGNVCVPLEISGTNFNVTTNFGTWENNTLCFTADTSGTYRVEVIGDAACNSDTCLVTVNVDIAEAVAITCPNDTTIEVCEADTLCFEYTVSPSAATVNVTAPAFLSDGMVCVPVLSGGEQVITMIAASDCGADTCSFTVTTNFNSPPVVTAQDTSVTVCEVEEICVPFAVQDADNNIAEITTSLGAIRDTMVCFTPPDFGTYDIILTATDDCGAVGADTVRVAVNSGGAAKIFCPQNTPQFMLCEPDTVCTMVAITPGDAEVTILPEGSYNYATNEVCLYAETSGVKNITIIAASPCGADTCELTIDINMAVPPVITSPGQIDTLLCLAEPITFCFPVEITGDVSDVTVLPDGSYADGQVCVPVDEGGTYEIEIIAANECSADTAYTTLTVREDQMLTLTVPEFQTFERCADDTDQICIDGIFADDVESPVLLQMTCGAGELSLVSLDSGEVCFLPDTFGVYQFCIEATDGCHTITDTFSVEVREKEDCDVCVRLTIDGGECTVVGVYQEVKLMIETNDPIGGFNLFMTYDPSVLAFGAATIDGTAIDGWEYFFYHLDSELPGLLQLVGLAETNNGAQHPPDSTLTPNGVLVRMQFLISNDQNLGGLFLPLNFLWRQCGDNSFSDPSGYDLYMDLRIYGIEGQLLWDEEDDVNFPESSRPVGMGTPDDCLGGGGDGKPGPMRCIEFINGGICVIPPESIDARGDINLNGIAYEISDAVVFTNYFIYGLGAFRINVDGQIAATDINADGLTLTVGDLVYLIRIIIGDADPVPKVVPYDKPVTLQTVMTPERTMVLNTEAVSTIGAAYFIYRVDSSLELGEPRLGVGAQDMDLMWSRDGDELRILVYNIGTHYIPAGANRLVEIPYSGSGHLTLVHSEIVDYQGRPYSVVQKTTELPEAFTLHQNYPNPFNPSTTISFTLPHACEWQLEIYNITGNIVRRYTGADDAGSVSVVWDGRSDTGRPVASGVYLYRLKAADYSATRKMVLLK